MTNVRTGRQLLVDLLSYGEKDKVGEYILSLKEKEAENIGKIADDLKELSEFALKQFKEFKESKHEQEGAK